MALTRSTAASIFSPEGNSLAVFIDVNDGELKLKDVFGDILPFSSIVGGGGLNLQNDALMTSTLTPIVDKDNTASVLRISTQDATNYGGGAVATNTAFGKSSLIANTTGANNTSLGFESLLNNTSGGSNTSVGYRSLYSNTTGSSNTANGVFSLFGNTTGTSNTAYGWGSLALNTTGIRNTAVGESALFQNTIGDDNVAVGRTALTGNQSGLANVGIGTFALQNNISGNLNVAIGNAALFNNFTGSSNTALGNNSSSNNFSGSVILGELATATANNQFVVGSAGTNAGAVTVEAVVSDATWSVLINGTAYKILLKS
jgi:hypothetical protein